MLIDELIELANDVRRTKTEGQTMEVKKALDGCPHALYDTLSSFSNQDSGGVLLFGLDEEAGFEICGVKKDWIRTKDGWTDEYTLQIINR